MKNRFQALLLILIVVLAVLFAAPLPHQRSRFFSVQAQHCQSPVNGSVPIFGSGDWGCQTGIGIAFQNNSVTTLAADVALTTGTPANIISKSVTMPGKRMSLPCVGELGRVPYDEQSDVQFLGERCYKLNGLGSNHGHRHEYQRIEREPGIASDLRQQCGSDFHTHGTGQRRGRNGESRSRARQWN